MVARLVRIAAAGACAGLLGGAVVAGFACAPSETGQTHFATPEEGFSTLVAAVRAGDRPALLRMLGDDAGPLLDSGDPVADRNAAQRFAASYDAAHAIERPAEGRAVLVVGEDEWPLPIPLVNEEAGWRFDTDAGDEEILARRIGRNERFAIQACLAFVDAEREYWERNPDGAPLLHYASQILSSEGERNGLYYPTGEGEEPSPLGEGFARAKAAGYEDLEAGKATPLHGYHFRVLKRQGPNAPGGAYDYMAGEWMIGGAALLAFPAAYDNAGVMSFLVNQDGVVYQRDLGPETAKLATAIDGFDPGEGWTRVPSDDL